jgi:AraC family transcriptional regulator
MLFRVLSLADCRKLNDMAKVHTIFNSDSLRIEEFHCRGTHASHGAEEYTTAHEIVFPRRGAFVRYDVSGKTLADANHVLFFHRHQPYKISHPISGGDSSLIFTVEDSLLLDIFRAYDVSVDDRPDKPFPVSQLTVDTEQRLQQYRLLRYDDTLAQEEAILTFLSSILCSIKYKGNHFKAHKLTTMDEHREIAHQIKIVLSSRFRQKLRLDDIAAAVSVSPFFLCRVFKLETGLSIHQYVQRLRLLGALEHLAEHPHADLTELALSLGFASHSHFSTAFLQMFSISPSEFRAAQQLGKNLKA